MIKILLTLILVTLNYSAYAFEEDVFWNNDHASNILISSDKYTVTGTTSGFGSARANIGHNDGCRVFEYEITSSNGSSRHGIGDANFNLNNYLGTSANSLGVWNLNISPISGSFSKLGSDNNPTQSIGTRYGYIIDFNQKKGWIKRNDVFRTSGANVSSGVGADFTFTSTALLYPSVSSYNPGDSIKLHTKYSTLTTTIPNSCLSWADNSNSGPPPIIGQAGIGFLGDSISWYLDQGSNSSATIYNFTPTFNYGVPSDTTTGMLSRTDSLIALKPKMVFLLGGVNDYSLPETTTVANILAIIDKFNAADIPVIVEGILPVSLSYSGPTNNTAINSRKNAVHSAILNYKGGLWLDYGSIFDASDYIDGIHLNAAGLAKQANARAAYINLNR